MFYKKHMYNDFVLYNMLYTYILYTFNLNLLFVYILLILYHMI